MIQQCSRGTVRGAVIAILALSVAPYAWAQQKTFDIPVNDAVKTIPEFARQAGVQIVAPADDLAGIKTPELKGAMDAREALQLLLIGTGLEVASDTGSIITLKKIPVAQSGTARVDELTEVIVTGSRLKRVDAASPNPVTVLTREKLDRSGAANLTDAIRNILPIQSNSVTDFSNTGNVGTGQSNINLRGLGNGSTLTLINGRRFALSGNSRINAGNVYNINAIPLGAIDRIEVLKDGASAIYGSDAIAGVVNLILRKDYNGTEARVYYNNTFDTDSRIVNGALTTGFSNDRGSGVITIETYKQNEMMASDRDFSASADQRSRGGLDVRVSPGLRGTVYAMPGQTLPGVFLPNGQPATFAAVPANQNGIGLTAADFAATAGVVDVMNQNDYENTVPVRDTVNIMGVFDYRLSDAVTLFGQVAYSNTDSHALIHNAAEVYLGQVTIPAGNPYNPFGVDVRIEKNLSQELGIGVRSNDYNDYGVVAGLRGPLIGGWEWESAFNYGQSTVNNGFNPYNRNRGLANALATDPAVAYNWFGDAGAGPVNDAAKINNLRGNEIGKGIGDLSMVDLSLRGPLFHLFGNQLQAAIGAEYRKDSYEQSYISDATLPTDTFTGVIQQQRRTTKSVFAEVEVPLVTADQNVPFVRNLELSLAGRYEDLGPYGTTSDPRVGLRWQLSPSLLLRTSWGTSFRAPAADQVGSAPLVVSRSVADPLRGNQVYSFVTYEPTDLGLQPETSDNFSAGLVFEPSALEGLSVSLDYYLIDYKDKFTYLFPDNAVRYPEFSRYVTRGAPSAQDIANGYAGPITSMQLGYVNLASTKVSGIDFDVSYTWDTALGRFNYSLLGTHTLQFDESFGPDSAVIERVGEHLYPKKWQGNTSLFFTRGNFDAGVTFRYVHSYHNSGFGIFNPPREIDATKEFDVQAGYRLPWDMRFTAGVINIFDRDPPFFYAPVFYSGNFGYDNTLTSPRGATYYMSLRKGF